MEFFVGDTSGITLTVPEVMDILGESVDIASKYESDYVKRKVSNGSNKA